MFLHHTWTSVDIHTLSHLRRKPMALCRELNGNHVPHVHFLPCLPSQWLGVR